MTGRIRVYRERRSCDIATAVYFMEEEEEEHKTFRWLCLTGQNEPWYWSPNQEAAANEEENRRDERGVFQSSKAMANWQI